MLWLCLLQDETTWFPVFPRAYGCGQELRDNGGDHRGDEGSASSGYTVWVWYSVTVHKYIFCAVAFSSQFESIFLCCGSIFRGHIFSAPLFLAHVTCIKQAWTYVCWSYCFRRLDWVRRSWGQSSPWMPYLTGGVSLTSDQCVFKIRRGGGWNN